MVDSNDIVGFYDDYKPKGSNCLHGNVLGPVSQIEQDFNQGFFEELIIGVGYKHLEYRKTIFEKFARQIPFKTFIHPSCYMDQTCIVGSGVIALPGCVFDMNVVLGD